MPFGNETIVFKHYTRSGVVDENGHQGSTLVAISAPGCRHRPLTMRESAEMEFNTADQPWKSTIPLFEYDSALLAAVLAAKANDVISVAGVDYQITGGVRPHDDMDSVPFKMTIISMRQDG